MRSIEIIVNEIQDVYNGPQSRIGKHPLSYNLLNGFIPMVVLFNVISSRRFSLIRKINPSSIKIKSIFCAQTRLVKNIRLNAGNSSFTGNFLSTGTFNTKDPKNRIYMIDGMLYLRNYNASKLSESNQIIGASVFDSSQFDDICDKINRAPIVRNLTNFTFLVDSKYESYFSSNGLEAFNFHLGRFNNSNKSKIVIVDDLHEKMVVKVKPPKARKLSDMVENCKTVLNDISELYIND